MTLALREVEHRVLPPEGHPTILIIDHDPPSRDSLAATLSVEGFDVVVAAGGDEGVALATSTSPSLILLDMQLADSQGLPVFRRIHTVSPGVPVIMMTARDDELDAVLALEAGAADHITKPLRPRELTARIRAVLRRVGYQPHPVVPDKPVGVYRFGPVSIDVSQREALVRAGRCRSRARSSSSSPCWSPRPGTWSPASSAWNESGATTRKGTAAPSTPT